MKEMLNTHPSCVSPSFVMIGHTLVELQYVIHVTFLADIYECKHYTAVLLCIGV